MFMVKGALDFSLKSIVNALYSHNLIDCGYTNLRIINGFDAMLIIFQLDKILDNDKDKTKTLNGLQEIKDIIK